MDYYYDSVISKRGGLRIGKNAIKVENRKIICNFYSLSYGSVC